MPESIPSRIAGQRRGRLALVGLVIALAAGPAAAEDRGEPTAMPARTVGVAGIGRGGHLAGLPLSSWGGQLELALGHRRWQAFAELSLLHAELGAEANRLDAGLLGRAGGGVRWLARSLELTGLGAIELHLEAFAAAVQYRWQRGGALTQPEIGAGVGWQLRSFRAPRIVLRMSARVWSAPTDEGAEVERACRGSCPARAGGGSLPGLMVVFGVAW